MAIFNSYVSLPEGIQPYFGGAVGVLDCWYNQDVCRENRQSRHDPGLSSKPCWISWR